jgi:glycosyltransferase involved in cell wall biosynthesis
MLYNKSPRVLYSFPLKIGAERICLTAWHQVVGLAAAGSAVNVLAGSVFRQLPASVTLNSTLAYRELRVPIRLLGVSNACRIHDWRTARWLERNFSKIDLVHGWPSASLYTIRMAKRLGIPFFLERPNTHTAYAYEAATKENQMLGIELPRNHDHQFNSERLALEEMEFAEADFLLCPSEFVLKSFKDRGYDDEKLLRHHYGFDESRFTPGAHNPLEERGLVMLYAGVCEPRKGLHYALESWLSSKAHHRGKFLICGEFVPGYANRLSAMLDHPSVSVLGHRRDLPEIMKKADIFVLSSVEEGSALVTYEARAAGCVLLVSDATGAVCEHMQNGMIHSMRNTKELISHLDLMEVNRELLSRLRESSLATSSEITWTAAGKTLIENYLSKVTLPRI